MLARSTFCEAICLKVSLLCKSKLVLPWVCDVTLLLSSNDTRMITVADTTSCTQYVKNVNASCTYRLSLFLSPPTPPISLGLSSLPPSRCLSLFIHCLCQCRVVDILTPRQEEEAGTRDHEGLLPPEERARQGR